MERNASFGSSSRSDDGRPHLSSLPRILGLEEALVEALGSGSARFVGRLLGYDEEDRDALSRRHAPVVLVRALSLWRVVRDRSTPTPEVELHVSRSASRGAKKFENVERIETLDDAWKVFGEMDTWGKGAIVRLVARMPDVVLSLWVAGGSTDVMVESSAGVEGALVQILPFLERVVDRVDGLRRVFSVVAGYARRSSGPDGSPWLVGDVAGFTHVNFSDDGPESPVDVHVYAEDGRFKVARVLCGPPSPAYEERRLSGIRDVRRLASEWSRLDLDSVDRAKPLVDTIDVYVVPGVPLRVGPDLRIYPEEAGVEGWIDEFLEKMEPSADEPFLRRDVYSVGTTAATL